MKWYDVFASSYDLSLERLYFDARVKTVEALELLENATVLDIACGTGANFPHLQKYLTKKGTVVGIDASKGMLAKAQKRIKQANWKNIHLIPANVQDVTLQMVEDHCGQPITFTHVVCTLGFSTFPNWEEILENVFELLAPNGVLVVMDVYAKSWNPQTWMVEKMAQADLSRRVWEKMETLGEDFTYQELAGSPWVFGGQLYVAKVKKS